MPLKAEDHAHVPRCSNVCFDAYASCLHHHTHWPCGLRETDAWGTRIFARRVSVVPKLKSGVQQCHKVSLHTILIVLMGTIYKCHTEMPLSKLGLSIY